MFTLDEMMLFVNATMPTSAAMQPVLNLLNLLVGAIAGGAVSFIASARTDARKEQDETRQLAMSVVAEMQAGLRLMRFLKDQAIGDAATQEDTMRYIQMPTAPLPISSEAAKRVGRFVTPVATAIANQLVIMNALKQHAETTRNMQIAGVLSDEKFQIRLKLMQPIALQVAEGASELERRVLEHYGPPPSRP